MWNLLFGRGYRGKKGILNFWQHTCLVLCLQCGEHIFIFFSGLSALKPVHYKLIIQKMTKKKKKKACHLFSISSFSPEVTALHRAILTSSCLRQWEHLDMTPNPIPMCWKNKNTFTLNFWSILMMPQKYILLMMSISFTFVNMFQCD